MMPGRNPREFINRTIENYELVKRQPRAYEVTQLVNSLLAAFVHPIELWGSEFEGMSVAEAVAAGFPVIQPNDPRDDLPKTYYQVLKNLRNGLSHGNLYFEPLGNDETQIGSIVIWNCVEKGNKLYRTWGTSLEIPTVEALLTLFTDRMSLQNEFQRPTAAHICEWPGNKSKYNLRCS